ncbi:GNAT family N-acetyltransferase [Exiguobacterium sp. SL-10]|uniref:GNAT family N-acetyltransferase n=1 Tax=Exiguobacterium sp. SL-10 TaxID=2510962 RepID=UPI001038D324|nr:GNAT family N-acetyltransferase [Exiguobacterium sp. SL-10]TCI28271.1 GNAT family N-acetyltransferase [Exiguobacterium sp. SL-10]
MLRLVKTSMDQEAKVIDFLKEWWERGETIVPNAVDRDASDFSSYVKQIRDKEVRVNNVSWVPSTTYWLTDGEELLGAANIRHELNDNLINFGGHIGYGIKPSARGRGLATKQLELALEKAKELGIERALITCDRTNVASRQVILNNGGVPDTPFMEGSGKVVERFWIELKG